MKKKPKDESEVIKEPTAVYKQKAKKLNVNPNEPFVATQEEWFEYIHEIEKGEFYPVEETFQRVSEWIKTQKK